MKIHILGICGTFMAGVAQIARQCGHQVSGSDLNVYPPMSTQLSEQGIILMQGYDPAHLDSDVDCIIVGNVIRRGNAMMEYVMEKNIPYTSGPEWLARFVLQERWVLAVSGTHGKTTTTSILTWMLESIGMAPGFLIGGVPQNFGVSARLGASDFFVIEADEYDSAFFDKRSKFVHYRPKTLILNNLEFDHADIFPDLAAIEQQFHHLVRTVPANGLIVTNATDKNLAHVLEKGYWSPLATFGDQGEWQARALQASGDQFDVYYRDELQGRVSWPLLGMHNVYNALAALAAVAHVGGSVVGAIESLARFENVKRRMEVKGEINGITLYDDFAHHPTAIATTLAGLRAHVGQARIIVVLEFGSYTMRSGFHKDHIIPALELADRVFCKRPSDNTWDLDALMQQLPQPVALYDTVDELVKNLSSELRAGDHVIVMSNSGFEGIHEKLIALLKCIA